jgi:hypothetical protein
MKTLRDLVVDDVYEHITKSWSTQARELFSHNRLHRYNSKSKFYAIVERIFLEYQENTDLGVAEIPACEITSLADMVQNIIHDVWLRSVNELSTRDMTDFTNIHQCPVCGEWAHYTVICNPIDKSENPDYRCKFKSWKSL